MFRPRIIPCLLLKGQGLVKTVKFAAPRYIGDPINAVHIYNAKEADELIFLDTTATGEGRIPPLPLIETIAEECFMPFAVGGGIKSLGTIQQILGLGTEKVVINSHAHTNPEFIRAAADAHGSSTIVVSIDVKKRRFGRYEVMTHSGQRRTGMDPVHFAVTMQQMGAGEIVLTAIDQDGTMEGYDVDLTRSVAREVDLPVVACGGAGKLSHFAEVLTEGGASAAAAGSFFVYHGRRRAVLISFPSREEQELLYT